MMEADYSPGDDQMMSEGKENTGTNIPNLGESKKPKPTGDHKMLSTKADLKPEDDLDKSSKEGAGDSHSDSENQDGKKKKKHRRRYRGGKNHRKWKPYDKMSWSEKKELEDKETIRATQKRETAFLSGHPVAPYNTTQFLMDDHFKNEAISPDLHRNNLKESNGSNSTDSYSDFYDETDEHDGFQQKNFIDTFNDIRQQELASRTKDDLVREYVEMEMKLERLEKKAKRNGRESTDANSSNSSLEREMMDGSKFLELQEQNDKLISENECLKEELAKLKAGKLTFVTD